MTPGKDCDEDAAPATTVTPPGRDGLLARVVRVSWPHLVLLLVYFVYLGLGGWVFLAIEGGTSQQLAYDAQLAEYRALKGRLDEAVRNLTEGREVVLEGPGNLTATWEEYAYLVEEPYLTELQFSSRADWTFTGSVLFCATTIATIGYGDAVPVTDLGRVLIVIYSLVGIPLTLTFLADIGGLLARLVLVISRAFSCRRKKPGSFPRSVRNDSQQVASSEPGAHHLQNGGPAGLEDRESEDDIRDVRLTLGIFRDSSDPVCGSQRSSRRNSAVDDLEIASQAAQAVNDPPGTNAFAISGGGLWTTETNLGFLPEAAVPEEEKKSPNGHGSCSGEVTDDRTDGNEEDTDRVTGHVPVALVVVILLVYTFLGALMIAYVEEWYYGEALYFTFVTLTTIGFGDFVPVKHYMDVPSFFGCLIYTIVGLSVMSMCIALVQAKVVKLMSKVAGKVGF